MPSQLRSNQLKFDVRMTNSVYLWPRLDLRQLAAFQAVSEAGSFAKAAERLGYTQPAVSHQVATLERIVGHRLFDRGPGRGRVTLTAAGARFADHATAALARLSCARADLDALTAGDSGVVRVGAFQSVSARLLPRLVHHLNGSDRSIAVEFTESADDDDLLAQLARGTLDFAFTVLPVDESEFAVVKLLNDPYYLAGSRVHGHRLEIDSLEDLAGTPIVAPRTCRSWARIAARRDAAGVEPRYAFRTDDNFALKGLLQSGIGVAFVSRLTLEMMGDDLDVAPVDHLVPARQIALTWSRHRTLSPFHERFVAITRATCDSLAPAS
jgi:DNA-binding transcriptional LysR family regulator